ncbi:GNAT family N-acetyltransferase [Microbaculum marinisediminis]|uniref:GNAT family N-acetyltransferase n=1 Tax=Microbaculum marinisediminis TaxID=2931392 RepID=A0AAW5R2N9_9HYPH|nr:GNAT family N-acetyltransferase [Microbaculum sp. A6E488]MCT8972928.1 GNAT family N-acetyltransferase [Microbaculum sp. A6E488]
MALTDGLREIVLSADDMVGALALSDEAGWNQTADDWRIFMESGEAYGVRAGDRLVASAAVLPFDGGIGWISMVLVTADWRRRGLASHLMNRCIAALRARGAASLLDATPEGAHVYGQLGFATQCAMVRWRGQGQGKGGAMPVTPRLRQRLLERDRDVFGGDRGILLESFMDRDGSFVVSSDDDFAIVRRGRKAMQIGPLVAGSADAGKALLEQAIAIAEGPVIVDLLDAGSALAPVLEAHGFEAFRTFERMILDRDALPGQPSALMVAIGPEFG